MLKIANKMHSFHVKKFQGLTFGVDRFLIGAFNINKQINDLFGFASAMCKCSSAMSSSRSDIVTKSVSVGTLFSKVTFKKL